MFEKMITNAFLAAYFAATVGAIALAAGLGTPSLQAGHVTRQATNTPVITLERVVTTGKRAELATQAPEQVAIVR